MKVDYLFSKSPKIGSRIISWAASYENLPNLNKGLPSHGAVLLDGIWVFESTIFTGVRIAPYEEWKKINEELYKIPCSKERHSEEVLKKAALLWNKKYDILGIAFFAWRYLGLILLKKALPSVNRWENPDKHFCTEFQALLTNQNLSMSSPAKTCSQWLEGVHGETVGNK
jgi:hypothetical protein